MSCRCLRGINYCCSTLYLLRRGISRAGFAEVEIQLLLNALPVETTKNSSGAALSGSQISHNSTPYLLRLDEALNGFQFADEINYYSTPYLPGAASIWFVETAWALQREEINSCSTFC